MILTDYVAWQFWLAPAWLSRLLWNIHRALMRSFSVGLLLRTLISPWRRDQLSYRNQPLEAVLSAFLLNSISRVIGGMVRSVTLGVWLTSEVVLIISGLLCLALFLVAPLLSGGLIIAGLLLLGS